MTDIIIDDDAQDRILPLKFTFILKSPSDFERFYSMLNHATFATALSYALNDSADSNSNSIVNLRVAVKEHVGEHLNLPNHTMHNTIHNLLIRK